METVNIFEQASRSKLRFAHKGQITVEDLWDLPVTELDSVYVGLARTKKALEGDSLLRPRKDSNLDLSLAVVKHVFETRQAAADAEKSRTATRQRNQKIMEILARKEEDALLDKDPDELRAMLAQED